MMNRAFLTTLMLLSVPLCFSSGTYAQTKDPDRDLPVVFTGNKLSGEWFDVNGEVTNNSANSYPCVYINFSLYARPVDVRSSGRHLGDIAVEVRDLQPRAARRFTKALPNPAWLVRKKSVTECSAPPESQEVILFENPNFGGPSRSFGIGPHTLVTAEDFNDRASSIKVPADLVVIVYEHSAGPGPYYGYGLWVDFLEDQPNLAQYNLDNKISHLMIRPRKTSDSVWVRNRLQNGQFEAGHYQFGRGGSADNPNPLIGPPKPAPNRQPPPPPPPVVCTIMGKVTAGDPQYRTLIDRTVITLYRDGSQTPFSARVTGGKYMILNVPVGTYQARGTGPYPVRMGPLGNMGPLAVAVDSSMLTCHPDGFASSVDFEIRSGEG
jgi:hypothetical protein